MTTTSRVRQMTDSLPLGTDPGSIRRRVETLELLLERAFVIPVLNRRIGLDALVGLVPGAGDIVTMVMGAYLVWEARNLGLSKWQMLHMAGNVAFDALVGGIPVAGDLFDFLFQSNTRNLRIIRKHLDKHHPETAIIEG